MSEGEQYTDRRKILVVDDKECLRNLLENILSMEGFPVDTAEDGVQAFELYKKNPYALVVTDKDMPNMNGLQLIETINAYHGGIECQRVPVVLTSGFCDIELEALKMMGFADFLEKPFTAVDLFGCVRKYV